MPLDKSALLKINFLISHVVGTQKNSLNETVLLSTKTHVKIDGQDNIHNFMLIFFIFILIVHNQKLIFFFHIKIICCG